MSKNSKTKKESIEITSPSNDNIKRIVKFLKDGALRKQEGVVIVDGQREINEAIKAGWRIKEFFYCQNFFKDFKEEKNNKNFIFFQKTCEQSEKNYKLSEKVFEKISYKKNPDGYLAVLSAKVLNFSNVKLKDNPLILILESVEKPGNLGAIIRTAYASGVDLIILNDQKTDLYSPNVIRSSTGFIFSMPLIISSVKETINWLSKKNIQILLTSLNTEKSYFLIDFNKPTAIVFGTEAFGLSDSWIKSGVEKIKIPMISGVDSLNVSVSVGVIVYEAIRQRKIIN